MKRSRTTLSLGLVVLAVVAITLGSADLYRTAAAGQDLVTPPGIELTEECEGEPQPPPDHFDNGLLSDDPVVAEHQDAMNRANAEEFVDNAEEFADNGEEFADNGEEFAENAEEFADNEVPEEEEPLLRSIECGISALRTRVVPDPTGIEEFFDPADRGDGECRTGRISNGSRSGSAHTFTQDGGFSTRDSRCDHGTKIHRSEYDSSEIDPDPTESEEFFDPMDRRDSESGRRFDPTGPGAVSARTFAQDDGYRAFDSRWDCCVEICGNECRCRS